jgi:hypothetical protein
MEFEEATPEIKDPLRDDVGMLTLCICFTQILSS